MRAAVEASRADAALEVDEDPSTEPLPRIAATSPAAALKATGPAVTGQSRRHRVKKRQLTVHHAGPSVALTEPARLPRRELALLPPPAQSRPEAAPPVAPAEPAVPGPPPTPAGRPALARFRRGHTVAAAVVVLAAVAAIVLVVRALPSGQRGADLLERREAVDRGIASAWVVRFVTPGTTIGCDRQMCAALEARGYPARDVRVLGPTSSPLSAELVIVTAAVRSLFGSYLGSEDAPLVLTSVGSGRPMITIRVVARHGAAEYVRQLEADLHQRTVDGDALLGGSQITTSAAARKELASGSVDTRLLVAVAALAGAEPIHIVDFGNVAVGGSRALPLRFADLLVNDPAARLSPTAYIAALRRVLASVPAEFRPLLASTLVLADHVMVLRIQFGAPSPLGVLAPAGSGR
jgi:hypothetical protein